MKLDHPLVVFDLETTGTWIEKDKIVEIAMVKCHPDGSSEKYDKRINPGIPIPEKVSELIGITNEDVKDAPKFKQFAKEILGFIGDSDLGGFNIERFDLPLLAREMSDAGIDFQWRRLNVFDAQKVYHLNEKRDLNAAFKFYCDKDLDNAHSASADTEATLEIIKAQVTKYGQGDDSIESLSQFNYKSHSSYYDKEKKFRWWNGKLYMMFGKYARKYSLQEVVKKDRDYCEWILSASFSDEVKDLVSNAINGRFPSSENDEQTDLFN